MTSDMGHKRLEALREVMSGLDSLLILPHNDPDPDAIASATALGYLLEQSLGVRADIVYSGIIGRAENKALVRYLNHPLRRLNSLKLRQQVPKALVDTQPGAGNNALPSKSTATIVIDHHPWREETAMAAFADVRSVGATSSILTEYLQVADVEIPSYLATALFYAIKTDTMGLGRGGSPTDAAAYFYLQSRIDVDALVDIERAQVPTEYFRSFDTALHTAKMYDAGIIISYVGQMAYPDLAAEMADLLLRLEGIRWVICMGVYQEDLILSVRTRHRRGGAGQLVRAIVGDRGTAGGHGAMAGGQVSIRGGEPQQLVQHLSQAALRYLKVPPETTGKPLI